MNRFVFLGSFAVGEQIFLSEEESHHLSKVLRIRRGQEVIVLNGQGLLARAAVVEPSSKSSRVEILSVWSEERPIGIDLYFGIPKPSAIEFILRRCTEVGIRGFHPLVTQHSNAGRSWNSRRWKKLLLEVCKQCESPYFPELSEPISLSEWLMVRVLTRPLVLCDEHSRITPGRGLPGNISTEVDLLIGPEGGWDEKERDTFLQKGGHFLGLGKNRLRTETAALVALVLLKSYLNGV